MTQTIRNKLGANIKKRRLVIKLIQAELAKKAGIDYKYLQKIVGKNTPDL